MWHPKGRKSGSDEERIRAPFVGFPVGREGLGAGREEGGGRRKKKGAEKGGGEGRIRWRDGLVLDAFGLFLFLLVWKDQERVSPLFSGSFRIFFWVNHRFVIRSGPAS